MTSKSPLHFAAETGELGAIDVYLRNGDDIDSKDENGHTALYLSFTEYQFEAFELLLERGADINSTTNRGETVLHWASLFHDEDLIEYLISNDANIEAKNNNGQTPLQLATDKNIIKSVELLLENGANINSKDNDGNTSLVRSVLERNTKTMKFLIGKGASLETKSKGGFTPLHWSVLIDDTRVMRTLLENGSNIDSIDDNGHTALHRAASLNKTRAARILMENGADSNKKGKTGHTPKEFAKTEAMKQILSEKAIDVLKMSGFDAVMQDDITVLEFLQDDARNIVIVDGKKIHLVNVRNIENYMEEAIVFACREVGHFAPSNVETDIELYNARKSGVIISGYLTASSVREATREAVRSNKRIYTLSETIREIPAIVNQMVFQGRSDMVSADHCQEGAGGIVRDLVNLNRDGIPFFQSLGDEFTETSVSLIINAYIIVKNSDKSSTNASDIKTKIMSDAEGILQSTGSNSFRNRIIESKLVIEEAEHLPILTNLLSIFVPTIKTIDIRFSDIEDFSFLQNLTGLKEFSSAAPSLNTWSAIHHLQNHHSETLEALAVPVSRPILTVGGFKVLKSVLLRDFDDNDGALEFIRGMSTLENLTLVSDYYDKSISILSTLDLRRLTISLPRFNGNIEPISNNVSLIELDLDLPSYTSTLTHLSILEDLVHLSVDIDSEFDLDTSEMKKLEELCVGTDCDSDFQLDSISNLVI